MLGVAHQLGAYGGGSLLAALAILISPEVMLAGLLVVPVLVFALSSVVASRDHAGT